MSSEKTFILVWTDSGYSLISTQIEPDGLAFDSIEEAKFAANNITSSNPYFQLAPLLVNQKLAKMISKDKSGELRKTFINVLTERE
jgi:hypothetical protein